MPLTRRQRRRRAMRKTRRWFGSFAVRRLGPRALALLARSWRIDRLGAEHYGATEAENGRLLALWHGRMLLGMESHAGGRTLVLVSPSDDGSLVLPLLDAYGYRVVRGSSSRGGSLALRALREELSAGGTVVVTPDGPRGPRHTVNTGIAWLARRSGFPVLPCGFVCDRAWRLRSWDAFTIPRPRARVALVYGEPIRVAPDAGTDALAEAAAQIRTGILEAERRGFRHLDVEPDW